MNDGLGHAAGDEALLEAGSRLKNCLRRTDTAGGDEFAVVLEDFEGEQEAATVAARVVEALKQPFEVQGQEIAMGASVGLCLVDVNGATADEIMRAADAATYEAKRKGKSRYAIHSPIYPSPLYAGKPASA